MRAHILTNNKYTYARPYGVFALVTRTQRQIWFLLRYCFTGKQMTDKREWVSEWSGERASEKEGENRTKPIEFKLMLD